MQQIKLLRALNKFKHFSCLHKVSRCFTLFQLNTFQLILTTNSVRTYLIFNYGPLTWATSMGRYAVAGVYASGNEMYRCSQLLVGNSTARILQLSETSNIISARGRFVVDGTNPLNCTSGFGKQLYSYKKDKK